MLKNIVKALNLAFIAVVLISISLTAWTSYVFVSQPLKSGKITKVITNVYESQKSSLVNIIELSKILAEDTTETVVPENNNIKVQEELLADLEDNSKSNESLLIEENGNNPLKIVIKLSEESPEDLDGEEEETNLSTMLPNQTPID
tara:strand:+ start:403 stop:840 length:438 start_codon:yes stop_codon:yes gene_type:complete